MKKLLFFALFLCGTMAFAQKELNNYKYVIVPEQFEFQNKKDEYSLNMLTKMALEKVGFTVFSGNTQYPADLALDRCRALYADIDKGGSFLATKMAIVLKDCKDNVVYKTAYGESKEKEKKKSYYEALREASHSLDMLNYNYNGVDNTTVSTSPKTEAVNAPAVEAKQVNNTNLLTANPTGYGYELLDKSGKLVLKMYKTTQADYYSAKMETITGVVFLKDGQWVFEYYDRDDKLVSEKLNIKF